MSGTSQSRLDGLLAGVLSFSEISEKLTLPKFHEQCVMNLPFFTALFNGYKIQVGLRLCLM
jgi:hypothetical protein